MTVNINLHEQSGHLIVKEGAIDLFLIAPEEQNGNRFPLFRFNKGDIVFGLKGVDVSGWQLLAVGDVETKVETLYWVGYGKRLKEPKEKEILFQMTETWFKRFHDYVGGELKNPFEHNIAANLMADSKRRTFIQNWYQSLFESLNNVAQKIAEKESERLAERAKKQAKSLTSSFENMATIMEDYTPIHEADAADSLTPAGRHISEYFKVAFPEYEMLAEPDQLTQYTGVQLRTVILKENWWQQLTNPLLLKTKEGDYCAALPMPNGKLKVMNPRLARQYDLTQEEAQKFELEAFLAYRPLPHKVVQTKDLFGFAMLGSRLDVSRLIFVGAMGGLLGLATPLFTGMLFDYVIPNAALGQMSQILMALIVIAFSIGAFEIVRAIMVIRLSGKINLNLEVAIWDRLIRLPVNFFSKYTTGDLTKRAMAISGVRQLLSGVVVTTLLSGTFSLFSFGLLFYYDPKLALIATGLAIIMMIVTILASYRQLGYYKTLEGAIGKIAGVVVQIITGISKIQASGKEKVAFSNWANLNSKIKSVNYNANWLGAALTTFNEMWLPIMTISIFAYISQNQQELSLGQFLAFNTAFGQFAAGMVGIANAISSVIRSLPMLKRAKPILDTLPEIHAGKVDPGEISGRIEVTQVAYRYAPTEPVVLKGVSFAAQKGQYIAVTGPSGSGKSTLVRLLLGFDKPLQGHIYFDEQDMAQLNAQRVRQQCGVVLQNSMLMSGSIFDNIIGSSALTIEDAWEAAKLAGLDKDIKDMPMGMFTVISERGGTLSGGQQQRLLIARALARKPKVIFFDEATSALDNQTQKTVIKSIDNLNVTRIVIAHRLTTIQNADLIIVMDKGQVVQQGTYDQLMKQPGLFQQMAARQLA